MSIKTILVPIPGDTDTVQPAMARTALAAAKALGAHADGLFVEGRAAATDIPAMPVELGSARAVAEAARRARADEEAGKPSERAAQAKEAFIRLCDEIGIAFADQRDVETLPSASWQETAGHYPEAVSSQSPSHDLMVAGSRAVARSAMQLAESTLLETGRPVLLAPIRLDRDLAQRVLIAWTDSIPSWHAVSSAIPFLERAERVDAVTISEDEDSAKRAQAALARYLAWHGVAVHTKVVAPHVRKVDAAILNEASEAQAGLIVMGAYSHGRLRERVFGGVSRSILDNAAATPVLMCH